MNGTDKCGISQPPLIVVLGWLIGWLVTESKSAVLVWPIGLWQIHSA
jgi:hypothetical protein